MSIQHVPVKKVKPNPNNPRIIKDEKYQKLVKSIREFPEMLEKRPLVCYTDPDDGKLVVLGGNMRLKAIQEVGLKTVPVMMADEWSQKQKDEFLIKDNVSYGDWDWEALGNVWDADDLNDWGLHVPTWSPDINGMSDDDIDLTEDFDPVGISAGFQRVVFLFDNADEAESYLTKAGVKFEKRNMAWQVNFTTKKI